MSIKRSMETLLSEILAELRHQHGTSTQLAGHLRGLMANDLLSSDLATFDSQGQIQRNWPSPFGSVAVHNHGTSPVFVSADPPQDVAPRGRGAALVPAGGFDLLDLHGTAVTLYGTPGDQVTLQAFTRAWPPAGGGGNPPSAITGIDSQTNAPAAVAFAAGAGVTHRLVFLAASYAPAPTGGRLSVADGASTIIDLDIAAAGPLVVPLPPGGIKGTRGQAMSITLAGGGAGVVGKVQAGRLVAG